MELVLGTAQLVHPYGVLATDPAGDDWHARADAVLRAAWDVGIRTLDTAPAYGAAESVIGRSGIPFAVHTKIVPGDDARASLDASLERLRRSEIDVLHLHDPDAVLGDPDAVAAAAATVGHGAAALGASVYSAAQFDAAVADPRVTVVQAPVNVLDRRIDDARLTAAAAAGTRVLARSVLLQGLLAASEDRTLGRVPSLDAALRAYLAVAREFDREPLALALGWVTARPGLSGVVLGAEDAAQVRRLAAVLRDTSLRPEELDVLRTLPLPGDDAVDPRHWTPPSAATRQSAP